MGRQGIRWLLGAVWFTHLTLALLSDDCPKLCSCWDQTVSCDSRLRYLPESISSTTDVMYVRNNDIPEISNGAFSGQGYSTLQRLYLINDGVQNILAESFVGLTELKYMYVTNNKLGMIFANSFQGLEEVLTLDLQYNQIAEIEPSAFKGMQALDTLDLSNNGIVELTNGLFTDANLLQVVNLDSNNLKVISPNVFSDVTNVKNLMLQNNQLEDLPWNAFSGLMKLEELDLSNNQLTTLDHSLFRDLLSLNRLELSSNRFEFLELDTFVSLGNLRSLSLHDNELQFLQPTIFENSPNLRRLTLHDNNLQTLHPKVFHEVHALEELDFHGNPWRCDCTMLPLKVWFQKAGKSIRIEQHNMVYCQGTPSHKLKNITRLEDVANTWLCQDPAEIHVEGDGTVILIKSCFFCNSSIYYILIVLVFPVFAFIGLRMRKCRWKGKTKKTQLPYSIREGKGHCVIHSRI